ncbi:MAG: hypothetical protein ACI9L7_001139, partial [Candidatus Azotimanducaceae bacterium]
MNKLCYYLLIISIFFGSVASAQTFQGQILSSSDDAEEKFNGTTVTTSSSDIELVYDTWNDQGLQTIGLRFDDVTIPANATVSNAYIQFTADGDYSGNLTMTISGEDIAISNSFSSSFSNISNRIPTTENVLWTLTTSWNDEQAGLTQRTPDLSAIVTEVLSSNGWQSGNPVTFIITGTGSETARRRAYSFDENSTKAA